MIESKSLNIAGHSLGGALTQMLALSLCDDSNRKDCSL
ncbi:lipase family protein [Helicobacter didelphidarum]